MNLLNSSCCFRNLLKNQVKFSECSSSKSRNQSASGSEHLRSPMTGLFNGETPQKYWCKPVTVNHHKCCNSARVLRSIQAHPRASTSPAHSRASASQFKGINLPGTAAFILRCVAFIRCREHKPELKTRTQIRQGSPASLAVPQSVQMLRLKSLLQPLAPVWRGQRRPGIKGGNKASSCQSRRERQVCRRKPQTKHCRDASDFHVMLAGLPSPSS